MDEDLNWIITGEERTRHDALFYSQNPSRGFLSGEQARSLFIRSRLPLSELSKIWKLADISRDNLLDVSEFATAMHLIQSRLKGLDIPTKLPTTLIPVRIPVAVIPPMTTDEWNAYQKTFEWKDINNTGLIDTETACSILLLSRLEANILANIWDLSDIDRDAKLSSDELSIALHLLRFYKKGNTIEGTVDARAMLPIGHIKDDGDSKRKRHTEVQTERRQLLSLKQKLCSEIGSGLDEDVVNEKIRPELNTVEEKLYQLEKEETELRRSLLNLKEKSKKENFKPFDRSFLLKKRPSGEDLFEGRTKKPLEKDSALFETLWISDGATLVNSIPSREERNGPTSQESILNSNISETEPSIISTSLGNRSRGTDKQSETKELSLNGIDSIDNRNRPIPNHTDPKTIGNSREISSTLYSREKENSSYREAKSSGDKQKSEESLGESFSWAPDGKRQVSEEALEETVITKPQAKKEVERNESFSWAALEKRPAIVKRVNEKVLEMPEKKQKVVEDSIQVAQKEVQHTNLDEKFGQLEKDTSTIHNHGRKLNSVPNIAVQENVSVGSVSRTESSANENIDKMFQQMSVDTDNGAENGMHDATSEGNFHKLPVGRVLSFEEEKKLLESGSLRKKTRQLSTSKEPTQEEMMPIFIEEKKKSEEERRRQREIDNQKREQAKEELRKIEEENRRQGLLRKSAIEEARGILEKQISQAEPPTASHRTGYQIEHELEEQKRRDAETQRNREEIRNMESEPLMKMVNDSRVHAKQVFIDPGPPVQENKPAVILRSKRDVKQNSNRKSWVEIEIEQQKLKDEGMRREIHERQLDLQRLASEQKHQHAAQRKIEISEPAILRTSKTTVESQPGAINVRQTTDLYSRPTSTKARHPETSNIAANRVNANGPAHVSREKNVPHRKENVLPSNEMITSDVVDGSAITTDQRRLEREFYEEEERQRIQQIEKVRQESMKREAAELVRLKNIREEELRKKKEISLREAEKRHEEEMKRKSNEKANADSRRVAFHAQKVILEERVIRNMKEDQSRVVLRSKNWNTNTDEQSLQQTESVRQSDNAGIQQERRTSIKEAKALFEQPSSHQDQAKVVMRKKRQSLNLEDVSNQQKPNRQNRASYYSDGVVTHSQSTREKEVNILTEDDNVPVRLNLGDISQKRQQFEKHQPTGKVTSNQTSQSKTPNLPEHVDNTNVASESFYPSISNSLIQREMEELKQREQEIQSRRLAMVTSSLPEQGSLENIKKNPLPSKIQIKKAPAPVAAAPEKEPVKKTVPKKNPSVRKSFMELEKEKEIEREEELRREREVLMREREEQLKGGIKKPSNTVTTQYGFRGQHH